MHIGVDFGSKLAGTTAVFLMDGSESIILQSEKKKDADRFIMDVVMKYRPTDVFIDAPLSLPGVYNGNGDNYFYRKCDQELSAMSPMFLGGLTARAIQLKDKISKEGIEVFETYPAAIIKLFPSSAALYNKRKAVTEEFLQLFRLDTELGCHFHNWHQIDASLCYISGTRYYNDQSQIFGSRDEGRIYI